MIISPSILAADFMNLENEIKYLNDPSLSSNLWLHLDVMDGHFVPNMTFGIPVIEQLSKITKIPLDVHLMVTNPEFYIEKLSHIGIENLTFHIEATANTLELLKLAKTKFRSVGLSIKPGTPVEVLTDDILKLIDLVLVMSVEPGFGGQKFMPNCIEKIKFLDTKRKSLNQKLMIQVDGGIDNNTAPLVTAAGADNLVAGSYIFKNPQNKYIETITNLLN